MTVRVAVVDYGSGNILSVRRALEACGAGVVMADTPEQVRRADRLVLPGVGAFADCMGRLEQRGLADPVREVAGRGDPFLGICVGMQILMETGMEFGRHEGLGLISGCVEAIPAGDVKGGKLKSPHIGWNRLLEPEGGAGRWAGSVLAGVSETGPELYFVHSFAANPAGRGDILAECEYGGHRICAAVQRDNVIGTQFHPEKSARAGLAMLEKFLTL